MQTSSAHLSLADLRARGWTPTIVARLLGEPDRITRNPHIRTAAPLRLYALARVEAAEATREFSVLLGAADRRSAAARDAAERRRQAVLARVAAVRISVPRLLPGELAQLAVSHRNRRDRERLRPGDRHLPDPASVARADPPALLRWQVNYLRHVLTDYDRLLDDLHGRTGRQEAERLLRGRVYQAIAAAYPSLRGECHRQLAARERG